jgi:fucose permease
MAISRVITSMSSQHIFKQLRVRFILVAVVFIALFVSNSPAFALLLCVAVGACYGPIWSYIMSLSAGMYPERTASVTGLISSACGIGGAVYPVFMSAIIANAPLGSGYLFLSVSSLVGFLLILIAHRRAVNY